MEYKIKFIKGEWDVLGVFSPSRKDLEKLNIPIGSQLKVNGVRYEVTDKDVNFDTTTNTCTTEVSLELFEE